MDRRLYILPVASIVLVLILIARPDITGFATATRPGESELSANISVSIGKDGFIPEDAIVTVYLDERQASMALKAFIEKTGSAYERVEGSSPAISYEGYGYGGVYAYSLPIAEFGLDTAVESGEHSLIIEVSYGEAVLSTSSEKITV